MRGVRGLVRSCAFWGGVAACGLVAAVAMPHSWPDWAFWGATAISCFGAAAWAFTVPEGAARS